MAIKELSQAKITKYDKILKDSSIDAEVKANKLTQEEKIEIKSYAIKKALKLQRYVRN